MLWFSAFPPVKCHDVRVADSSQHGKWPYPCCPASMTNAMVNLMPASHVELLLHTLSGLSEIRHTHPYQILIPTRLRVLSPYPRFCPTARTVYQMPEWSTAGSIGRAENKALVRYLKHPLQRFSSAVSNDTLPVIMADTQPGAGNNMLPHSARVVAVIDHRCLA